MKKGCEEGKINGNKNVRMDKMPAEICDILGKLKEAGFKAYVVGGAVRDILLQKEPKDWDVATNATAENIRKIFPDSVYENDFGTVGVKTRSDAESLKIVEVTVFRKEGYYSDFRHPDKVEPAKNIEEDLARRDFTINAIALSEEGNVVDPFGGMRDAEVKIVRAVGDPNERFREDALRLIRAVRFAAELGFDMESATATAISANADLLQKIAKERIRDELVRIIMSSGNEFAPAGSGQNKPAWGISQLENLGLLRHIIPELREGIGVSQNKHHIYTVWEHNIRALDYAARENASFEVRMAALLHDVGKPRSKSGEGPDATFYNHEIIGARMARKITDNLKFPKKISDKIVHLVRHHLFYYNVGEVTEAGVRRFINRVREENIDDLLKIREADRIGSGVPKAIPYKTRHLRFMIDKVRRDPIGPGMLKIRGDSLMERLKISPSPKVGMILSILLEEVLDDPNKNDEEILLSRAEKLNTMEEAKLREMSIKAKGVKQEFEAGEEREMKKKHKV